MSARPGRRREVGGGRGWVPGGRGEGRRGRVRWARASVLGEPLGGTVTPLAAMRALAGVAPALEVIDSRYRDFRFSLPDVVADNCSAAAIVVGPWADPTAVDLANLGLLLEIDGKVAQVGSTAAILGHPVRSLVAAARLVGASSTAWSSCATKKPAGPPRLQSRRVIAFRLLWRR